MLWCEKCSIPISFLQPCNVDSLMPHRFLNVQHPIQILSYALYFIHGSHAPHLTFQHLELILQDVIFFPTWLKCVFFLKVSDALTSAIQLVNVGPKPWHSPLSQAIDTTSTYDASWSHIVSKRKGLALRRYVLPRGGTFNYRMQWSEAKLGMWWIWCLGK